MAAYGMSALALLATPLLALAAPVCIAGPPEPPPSWAESLRPLPTARCVYPADDLYLRIGRLFALTDGQLGREAIERLFALPPMTTQFDDPRSVNYAIRIEGQDGWKLQIVFSETFYPVTGPAEFTPARRPARIHARRRGAMRLSLSIEAPVARCLTGSAVQTRLETLGWREQPPEHVLDSGPVHGGFRRGKRLSLSLGIVPGSPCLRTIEMGQTPPGA
jgi:hypothetical protein